VTVERKLLAWLEVDNGVLGELTNEFHNFDGFLILVASNGGVCGISPTIRLIHGFGDPVHWLAQILPIPPAITVNQG
jgi:hypothetical protein